MVGQLLMVGFGAVDAAGCGRSGVCVVVVEALRRLSAGR